MLETQNLTVRFGGHVAVNAVSCRFEPGTLTAIVGPNGAGKTTYFNLISGQLPASQGRVWLGGRDLSGWPASQRTRAGLGRAFQLTNLFPNLSVLENVRLPASAMLPEARGLGGPLSCLNEARFGIVFGVMGAARDALETTIAYTQNRDVFDRPLSSYQLTQEKLANMTLELGKGVLLAIHLGRIKDAQGVAPEQVSLGKLNNAREALAIARECRTLLGGSGITLEYSPLRHANNLESVLTYEGTSEMHMLSIGKALTGHAAFR